MLTLPKYVNDFFLKNAIILSIPKNGFKQGQKQSMNNVSVFNIIIQLTKNLHLKSNEM